MAIPFSKFYQIHFIYSFYFSKRKEKKRKNWEHFNGRHDRATFPFLPPHNHYLLLRSPSRVSFCFAGILSLQNKNRVKRIVCHGYCLNIFTFWWPAEIPCSITIVVLCIRVSSMFYQQLGIFYCMRINCFALAYLFYSRSKKVLIEIYLFYRRQSTFGYDSLYQILPGNAMVSYHLLLQHLDWHHFLPTAQWLFCILSKFNSIHLIEVETSQSTNEITCENGFVK